MLKPTEAAVVARVTLRDVNRAIMIADRRAPPPEDWMKFLADECLS